MLVKNQIFETTWNIKNKEHYVNKGYKFTKYGDKFQIQFEDILDNSNISIKVICDYCHEEFAMSYQHYNRGIKKYPKIACQKCSGIKTAEISLQKRQDEIYCKLLEICRDKKYTLITQKDEIINNRSEISYICPLHGLTVTKATNLLQGKGCKQCGRISATKKQTETTLQDRQNNLYEKIITTSENNNYKVIIKKEDIKCNTDILNYICSKHGFKSMRISNFISGKGCPECAEEKLSELFRLSNDEVEQRINQLGGVWLNKGCYINNAEKNLLIQCSECGKPFITSLSNYTQYGGQACPECLKIESNGERRIRHWLEANNILFKQEKWFEDCRDQKPLPFDFYLFQYNICIEYDGEQHFSKEGYFRDTLQYIQMHDTIKNNYCFDNGIKLIRIPYWDYDNIETILNNEIIYLHKDIV